MTEAFIHYLWQFQQFNKSLLRTTNHESIKVLKTGILNTDAGPDFSQARIQIGEIEWAGNIEIHIKSSDWNNHNHQYDGAYNNVILHVVWEHDKPILRKDGSEIPTLELNPITNINLLTKYQALLVNKNIIPCAPQFKSVSDLARIATLDKALTKRLIQKAKIVGELLEANQGDWEETTYQLLARNFGFKINSEAFLRLAQNLPLKVLQKHRDNLTQIEAIFFGQSGLLTEADDYSKKLIQEYEFFSSKFSLKDQMLDSHEWKLLRTRPANFPTIRIAQLAKLITLQKSFFSLFTQTESIEDLRMTLQIKQSEYWLEHYHFDKKIERKSKGLGKDSIDNLLINTVIPLLACYSQKMDNQIYMDRAIAFLESFPPESNHIIDMWKNLGLEIKSAFDAQAGIELYNNFCSQKKCLQCNIGIEILKK
ncbi:DUF2851 family protein [Emticicia sp. C21]|uniref:DUF2851 family protein n=1 Tax=Emticicia sp. C21 TaxID=2302915 RepID=UPI000E355141|nr:DUF2851 family protein [Emticicia sp. C21]RFS18003.1 DUF2851 family protein [Emticicia sp. C21]